MQEAMALSGADLLKHLDGREVPASLWDDLAYSTDDTPEPDEEGLGSVGGAEEFSRLVAARQPKRNFANAGSSRF